MQQTIGTTPVPLGPGLTLTDRDYRTGEDTVETIGLGRPLIQNLGPGVLYVDLDEGVAVGTGLRVAVDAMVELPALRGVLYGVADAASTDVRLLDVG